MTKKVKPRPYWEKVYDGKWRLCCHWPKHYQSQGPIALQIDEHDQKTSVTVQITLGFELYIPSYPHSVCNVPRKWLLKELKLSEHEEIWDVGFKLVSDRKPDMSCRAESRRD